jgi:hypothetical protein
MNIAMSALRVGAALALLATILWGFSAYDTHSNYTAANEFCSVIQLGVPLDALESSANVKGFRVEMLDEYGYGKVRGHGLCGCSFHVKQGVIADVQQAICVD